MNLSRTILRSAAICSSILLLGGFVAFRAGALNSLLSDTTAAAPPIPVAAWASEESALDFNAETGRKSGRRLSMPHLAGSKMMPLEWTVDEETMTDDADPTVNDFNRFDAPSRDRRDVAEVAIDPEIDGLFSPQAALPFDEIQMINRGDYLSPQTSYDDTTVMSTSKSIGSMNWQPPGSAPGSDPVFFRWFSGKPDLRKTILFEGHPQTLRRANSN